MPVDQAGLDRQAELGGEGVVEAGDGGRGAGEHGPLDAQAHALLGVVEVERVADLAADAADAVEQDRARLLDDLVLVVGLDLAERRDQADVAQPAAGVLQRERLALGELDGDGLEAAADDAGEEAGRALGDREVREAADREVEDRLAASRSPLGGAARGSSRRPRGRCPRASGRRPCGGHDAVDHVAAGRDDQRRAGAGRARSRRCRAAGSRGPR